MLLAIWQVSIFYTLWLTRNWCWVVPSSGATNRVHPPAGFDTGHTLLIAQSHNIITPLHTA